MVEAGGWWRCWGEDIVGEGRPVVLVLLLCHRRWKGWGKTEREDGRWRREREAGLGGSVGFSVGGGWERRVLVRGGWLCLGWGRRKNCQEGRLLALKEIGLGLGFFLYFFSKCVKLPLIVCVVKLLFIDKNVARSQTWSLNFFFYFCKFDFSYFFGFFLSTSTRIREIDNFKNNVLKVERVPKIFENLNSLDDVEKAKNDANIFKNIFLNFCCFFTIFGFFKKFIKNMS